MPVFSRVPCPLSSALASRLMVTRGAWISIPSALNTNGNASRRLGVVETLMIDTRHKIYLLRRDDREHLVLVGPEGASVVENGIAAPAAPVVLHLHDGARG